MTLEKKGIKERECSVCGEKETGEVEALGHDYEEVEGAGNKPGKRMKQH